MTKYTQLTASTQPVETKIYWEIQDLHMDGHYHRSSVSVDYQSEDEAAEALNRVRDADIVQRIAKIETTITRVVTGYFEARDWTPPRTPSGGA